MASVRDLGMYFDADVMPRSENSCQLLRHFMSAAQYPTISSDVTIPYAHRRSRLDYGSDVLVGLPAYPYSRLQSVLNAATRSIASSRHSNHITDTLD